MNKNKSKSAKIALIITILFFSGIMSYAFIASNSPINPPPQISAGQNGSPCPGTPTVTDIDGNIYKTVQIGSQCWMKENLKVTKDPEKKQINRLCYYDDLKNCETSGGLYNWNTTMNGSTEERAQGICPTGWHVPKDSEWYILESGLATEPCNPNRETTSTDCDQAGIKLKLGGSSGFNGSATGYIRNKRYIPKEFGDVYFWSSTGNKDGKWIRRLMQDSTMVDRGTINEYLDSFLSIRCLKD